MKIKGIVALLLVIILASCDVVDSARNLAFEIQEDKAANTESEYDDKLIEDTKKQFDKITGNVVAESNGNNSSGECKELNLTPEECLNYGQGLEYCLVDCTSAGGVDWGCSEAMEKFTCGGLGMSFYFDGNGFKLGSNYYEKIAKNTYQYILEIEDGIFIQYTYEFTSYGFIRDQHLLGGNGQRSVKTYEIHN